jgi:hypothetical protein
MRFMGWSSGNSWRMFSLGSLYLYIEYVCSGSTSVFLMRGFGGGLAGFRRIILICESGTILGFNF